LYERVQDNDVVIRWLFSRKKEGAAKSLEKKSEGGLGRNIVGIFSLN